MPSRLYIGRKQEERASLRVSHRAEVALVQGEDVSRTVASGEHEGR
jgi:hypothetical protein